MSIFLEMVNQALGDPKSRRKAGRKVKKWIKGSIKHPGSLRRFTEEHRLLNKDGTIDLRAARAYVKRNLSGKAKMHRLRQINEAARLRSFD